MYVYGTVPSVACSIIVVTVGSYGNDSIEGMNHLLRVSFVTGMNRSIAGMND